MSLSVNKVILAGSNNVTNTAGAYYQQTTISTFTSTSVGIVVPAGVWQVVPTANVSITFNTSNNASALSFVTIIAANTGAGLVISDGVNVYANASNTSATITLYGPNGGQAVSGTYTS
jgi:hypothetical protein